MVINRFLVENTQWKAIHDSLYCLKFRSSRSLSVCPVRWPCGTVCLSRKIGTYWPNTNLSSVSGSATCSPSTSWRFTSDVLVTQQPSLSRRSWGSITDLSCAHNHRLISWALTSRGRVVYTRVHAILNDWLWVFNRLERSRLGEDQGVPWIDEVYRSRKLQVFVSTVSEYVVAIAIYWFLLLVLVSIFQDLTFIELLLIETGTVSSFDYG